MPEENDPGKQKREDKERRSNYHISHPGILTVFRRYRIDVVCVCLVLFVCAWCCLCVLDVVCVARKEKNRLMSNAYVVDIKS